MFVLAYVVLVIPWPGIASTYGRWFRTVGTVVLGAPSIARELTFEPLEGRPGLTRVVIVNRAWMNPDGSGPVRNLDFDAFALGWKPSALLAALLFALPIPWTRRIPELIRGILALQAFALLTLGLCIWQESAAIGLAVQAPRVHWIVTILRSALTSHLSLAMPVLLAGPVFLRLKDPQRTSSAP